MARTYTHKKLNKGVVIPPLNCTLCLLKNIFFGNLLLSNQICKVSHGEGNKNWKQAENVHLKTSVFHQEIYVDQRQGSLSSHCQLVTSHFGGWHVYVETLTEIREQCTPLSTLTDSLTPQKILHFPTSSS
jgi:hypothetical protein